MGVLLPTTPSSHRANRKTPPLQNGDHLLRQEFERRYAEAPDNVRAELVEGTVYLTTRVSAGFHGIPHAELLGWLGVYRAATPAIRVSNSSAVRLDDVNEFQPDASVFIDPARGGRIKMSPEGYLEGGPELIVEVTASSVSIDLNQKLNAYRRNGVREYVVFRTYDGEVDWFVLSEGQFFRAQPDSQSIHRSTVFPGLWLKADALIAGDIAAVLATLQSGLASAEHAAFVKQLSAAAPK